MPLLQQLTQKRILALFLTILCAAAPAFAQSTFGTFVGTVQDQSGSVISGAIVTITNLDENTVRSATTNTSGQYQLLNVPAGRYSISVIKPGFATAKVNEVQPRGAPRAARRSQHGRGFSAANRGGERGGCHCQHRECHHREHDG